MVTELGLRNNRLLLYALLYGFSQDKNGGGYSGKQDYLMEWLGCSREALRKYIIELKERGLLYEVTSELGVKCLKTTRNSCQINWHDANNLGMECQNSGHEDAKNIGTECQENRHPTIYNTTDNTIYNYSCSRGAETTTPPTAEEVAAYCRERGNDIDASRFVDYYAVSGWKLRGKPIEDWRALIRLWEQNGRANKNTAAGTVGSGAAAGDGETSYDPSKTSYDPSKTSFDTDDFWAAALKKSYGG